jgi:hypothetical protein
MMAAAGDVDRAVSAFRRLASGCGVTDPIDISYVISTLGAADPAVGWTPETSQVPAVVISGEGSFVGFRRPLHATAPTGRYLRVIVRCADASLVGYSISDQEPDLAALGAVHRL